MGRDLATRPPVVSTAWAKADQPLGELFTQAHEAGAKVLHTVSTVPEALRAAEAGADAVVAQGTEGGGHGGLVGTMVLVPMVARAIAPVPVIAAGGLADGAGLAAALMLGAQGALFGTRFLATTEASIPEAYERLLIDRDGHDTVLTELPDVANSTVSPGAYARIERNRFYETWAGREGELRYRRASTARSPRTARRLPAQRGAPERLAGQTAPCVTKHRLGDSVPWRHRPIRRREPSDPCTVPWRAG